MGYGTGPFQAMEKVGITRWGPFQTMERVGITRWGMARVHSKPEGGYNKVGYGTGPFQARRWV